MGRYHLATGVEVMLKNKNKTPSLLVLALLSIVVGQGAAAQDLQTQETYSYSLYGVPGLIDMPTAQSAEDAELAATIGHFAGSTRTTLSFQITPRLSGSFRYASIDNWFLATGEETYDRSFDLRYQLLEEGRTLPAIAIGLQDMIGTGIYSAEYIVATKHLVPELSVTAGLGWGRFASDGGFENPLGFLSDDFNTRETLRTGRGGRLESSKWFRGEAAFFGGVAWKATDRLALKVEYSSDSYTAEASPQRALFERKSPYNFGLSYAVSDAVSAQAFALYGREIGASLTFVTNPKRPAVIGGIGQRPTPVLVRAQGAANDLAWTVQSDAKDILRGSMQRILDDEGITLEAIKIEQSSATILIRNRTYVSGAEAVGRTARILAQVMPASVENFTIVPVVNGVRAAAVTILRTDLERLEFDPANVEKSLQRVQITDATQMADALTYADGLYPRFRWGLGPSLSATYFDPNNPVSIDIGAELTLGYHLAPGLTVSAAMRKSIANNRLDTPRVSNSIIQRVRSDGPLYSAAGDPALTQLVVSYQTNVAPDFYGRVTAGYLEQMYGGLSTELLWKPVDSRLGIGLELNYAKQRDFEQRFGFQDYEVVTGHLSGYYDFGNSFHGQLDVGRYLAGDYGATITLDREFANGWSVGAFATFTDVPFDDFGEGSFDKGLRFTVPLTHFVGTPTRQTFQSTVRPLQRDGGARLNVPDRLYQTVRDYHRGDLEDGWGRFWR